MKKLVIVLALAAIIATGTAFADHPSGLGVGVVGSYGFIGDLMGRGGGLSLKIPGVPIYWSINVALGDNYFGLSATGDSYLIDKSLSGPLSFFVGVGGFFTYLGYSAKNYLYNWNYSYMYGGIRAPVGISFQPMPLLELFADIAPSLGVKIYSGYEIKVGSYNYKDEGSVGFGWGAPLELGIRLWF